LLSEGLYKKYKKREILTFSEAMASNSEQESAIHSAN